MVVTSPISLQREIYPWPLQNSLLHSSLCTFSNNPSTHIPGLHQLTPRGTFMCSFLCIYLHTHTHTHLPQSEFLQEGTALLVFLPRTSQGYLQHSKLPGSPAPTSATQALQKLLDIPPTLGVVFHIKALFILIQGKNMLGPASSRGPRSSS